VGKELMVTSSPYLWTGQRQPYNSARVQMVGGGGFGYGMGRTTHRLDIYRRMQLQGCACQLRPSLAKSRSATDGQKLGLTPAEG
jgi:hypothetical protein